MAIRIEHTGNNAEQIAALLEESGLFRQVTFDSSTNAVACYGADNTLRMRFQTYNGESNPQATFTFRISETSEITYGETVAAARGLAVETVYLCRRGVILSCKYNAVLLTKNNLGEVMYVIGVENASTRSDALRTLRVYAYGDRVRSSYPYNLYTGYNQRDSVTVFVPFITDSGNSAQMSYSPDAFFLPFYQFTSSGSMISDAHRYLHYAGCWAIADE